MGTKKPTVYATGPACTGEHFIAAKEYTRTVRVGITFKKGLGKAGREDFRKKLDALFEAVASLDARAEEIGLPPYERV